ncbi:hypothetical protein HYX14_04655 [Candidatus Woesearchaeota archaeon]|nr:hypothetical protein [Candidatus Woesearchaeota archaeon]
MKHHYHKVTPPDSASQELQLLAKGKSRTEHSRVTRLADNYWSLSSYWVWHRATKDVSKKATWRAAAELFNGTGAEAVAERIASSCPQSKHTRNRFCFFPSNTTST